MTAREHVGFARFEISAAEAKLHAAQLSALPKQDQKCCVRLSNSKSHRGCWEHGLVAGYAVLADKLKALVVFTERPADDQGHAQSDFVDVTQVIKWRPIRERVFKL
jgi:hypothetical protein